MSCLSWSVIVPLHFLKQIFYGFISSFFLILAEDLSGETAGYQGYVVEVSVGHQVSEHPQEVAHLRRVDVGLVEVGVDQMREPDDGIEQVTQREMENQSDRIKLKNGKFWSIFSSYVGNCHQS